jgi:ATP-dependent DNA helicase RecG
MSSAALARALLLHPGERGSAVAELAEDQWFDRKSARIAKQALANHLVGFANADGGTIVVGIGEGAVEGTDARPEHRNELMQAAIDLTEPPARVHSRLVGCVTHDGQADHLLVIEIDASESVHANQRDEVFLRIGDENRKLTFRQRQELAYDKGQAVFDGSRLADADIDELDSEDLARYASLLGHPDPHKLLRARGLLERGGGTTVAAYLMFGVAPQQRMPEAYLRVHRYMGTGRGAGAGQRLLHDRRCEGSIPRIIDGALESIGEVQPARQALREGRFAGTPLIPEDAWIEGIVNAVVHRSYSLGGDHIRVDVFDDRIEIESPGRFPGLVDPVDPRHISRFARNPRIARVCADMRFGQELGEGIRRMFEEMHAAGLADPVYLQTAGAVRLTLSAIPVDRALEARLPSHSREILEILRQAGQLGTGEIADALNMGRPAVIRRLKALQDVDLIEWSGNSPKDPRAYWKIRW